MCFSYIIEEISKYVSRDVIGDVSEVVSIINRNILKQLSSFKEIKKVNNIKEMFC
jgi:hypothetical protein